MPPLLFRKEYDIMPSAVRGGGMQTASLSGSGMQSYDNVRRINRAAESSGSVSASGVMNSAADQISRLQGIAQANSAFNASQAQIQRDWAERQSAQAMEFNASEAAKNRDWQMMMSNTAHQREVKDLMAAGLNPVLSAMNGNGAAVTSGATASGVVGSGSKADADTSTSGAIANLLGSVLSAQTAIQSANINARTQEAVADKYTAMEHIVAQLNAAAGIESAGIHANATLKSAGIHAGATRYASEQAAAADRYIADRTKYGMLDSAIGSIFGLFSGDFGSSSVTSGRNAVNSINRSLAKYDNWSKYPGGITPWNDSLLGKVFNKLFKK